MEPEQPKKQEQEKPHEMGFEAWLKVQKERVENRPTAHYSGPKREAGGNRFRTKRLFT